MNNSHDEIKNLIKASKKMLKNQNSIKEEFDIKMRHGLLVEQELDLTDDNVLKKQDISKNVDDKITDDTEKGVEKKQGYRISGGKIFLYGKEISDLELTTDEKIAFQETMEEFVNEVSDLVNFNKLNVYPNNVEWSGYIIDFDLEFFLSIGENNGVYINGNMMKVDENFLQFITKLKKYYEKFKSKWARVLANRKKTK